MIALAGGSGTAGLVDAAVLDALGPTGLLVNIARGSIVAEDDLIAALQTGAIGSAALDVFENEPAPRREFAGFTNTVLTPHAASATVEARRAMGRLVIDNLAAFHEGRPLVSPIKL